MAENNTPSSYDPAEEGGNANSSSQENELENIAEDAAEEEIIEDVVEDAEDDDFEDDDDTPSREDKKAAAAAAKAKAKKERAAATAAAAKAKAEARKNASKNKGKAKRKTRKAPKPFPTKIVAISAGAVALVAAGALLAPTIIGAVSNGGWNPSSSLPKHVADMGSPLVLGNANASTTLSIWTDFHGIYGKEEQIYGGDFVQLAADKGKIRAEYYMTAYLDQDGSEGSMRAANAALCASDQNRFFQFMNYAFDRQPVGFTDPTDTTGKSYIIPDGYSEKELLAYADDLNLANKGQYESCVKSVQYRNYVDSVTKAFTQNKYTQIPTVLLNGTELTSEQYRLDVFADILGVGWTDVSWANGGSSSSSTSTPAPSASTTSTPTPTATTAK